MIIETELREETTHYSLGDQTAEYAVLPQGLPGKNGAVVLMLTNLKYFLEMFALDDRERYLSPYEILANLEERVRDDMEGGEIDTSYLVGYKREPLSDGDVIFEFSHFEVNSETEPDENYRSLYIYFEYTGSVS